MVLDKHVWPFIQQPIQYRRYGMVATVNFGLQHAVDLYIIYCEDNELAN